MSAMVNDAALPDPDHDPEAAIAVPRPAVTVRAAPRREPPFDDELASVAATPTTGQMLPFDGWPDRLTRPRSWVAARPTGRRELPDPQVWGRRLLVALLEARAGRRPIRQLAVHLSPSVLAGVADAVRRGAWAAPLPAAIRAVHSCEPADGVAEIAAVIDLGSRCQAVAARLEGMDGRWRCVRLQFG